MTIRDIVKKLITQFRLPAGSQTHIPQNEMALKIDGKLLHSIIESLLENGIWHLTTITAVKKNDNLHLLYHFWMHGGLTLDVPMIEEKKEIISIADLIPGAEFYEREIFEMDNVTFIGKDYLELLFRSDNTDTKT